MELMPKNVDFIRSVRKTALSRGREGDNTWIAHYAVACFAGAALRWLEGLDEDLQTDWRRLRKAMLQRWPDGRTGDFAEGVSAISLGECQFRLAISVATSRLRAVLF